MYFGARLSSPTSFAQLRDDLVDRVVAVERAAPDLDQQLFRADHFAGVLGQRDQHFHHARLERDFLAVDRDRQPFRLHQQRADAEAAARSQRSDPVRTLGHGSMRASVAARMLAGLHETGPSSGPDSSSPGQHAHRAGIGRPCVVSSAKQGDQPLAGACQPQLWPSFCCFSQACSGAKYSSTALPSIFSPPVSSFIVFCQGWLAPLPSIAQ